MVLCLWLIDSNTEYWWHVHSSKLCPQINWNSNQNPGNPKLKESLHACHQMNREIIIWTGTSWNVPTVQLLSKQVMKYCIKIRNKLTIATLWMSYNFIPHIQKNDPTNKLQESIHMTFICSTWGKLTETTIVHSQCALWMGWRMNWVTVLGIFC